MSCTVSFSVCPICKTPVTFGGGITTVKDFLSSGVELKYLFDFQCDVHFSSIDLGSKFFDSSILAFNFWFKYFVPGFNKSIQLFCTRMTRLKRMTTDYFFFSEPRFNIKLDKSVVSVSSVFETGRKFTGFRVDGETHG